MAMLSPAPTAGHCPKGGGRCCDAKSTSSSSDSEDSDSASDGYGTDQLIERNALDEQLARLRRYEFQEDTRSQLLNARDTLPEAKLLIGELAESSAGLKTLNDALQRGGAVPLLTRLAVEHRAESARIAAEEATRAAVDEMISARVSAVLGGGAWWR